ncbi:MAG: hypothetical protein ACOYMF_18145 [Bacteroidales bacterium]
MEDLKNSTSTDTASEIPQLTSESVAFLLKAAKWGKFLAILGFIVTGLMVMAGIAMSFVLSMVSEDVIPLNMPFSPKVLSLIYIIIAAIYVIPVFFLNSFSNNVSKAVSLSNTENMTTSLRSLKNLFVFIGISTIVILTFYTIILIVVGTAALIGF